MKRFLSLIVVLLFALVAEAKITVQLFTHAPVQEYVFTSWGHSELRVLDDEEGTDVLYSYGVFSFDDVTKFVYNFVKGDTDYMVEAKHCSFGDAIDRVTSRKKVDLRVQTLDLTQQEAKKLKDALAENASQEGWTYRYNFFYDNCATRPRMMMEDYTGAKFDYQFQNVNRKSYRKIIHEMLSDMPWYAFGIDICLGRPCDEVPNDSLLMFLPANMAEQFALASITDSLGTRSLVSEDRVYNPLVYRSWEDVSLPSPMVAFWVFFALVVLHCQFYARKKIKDTWFDFCFFGLYGLLGVLVFFLQFISTHPCVCPNFNIFWANPLLLLFPIFIMFRCRREMLIYLHCMNIFMLVPALLIYFYPDVQEFNGAFLPIIFASLVRSYFQVSIYVDEKKKLKNNI